MYSVSTLLRSKLIYILIFVFNLVFSQQNDFITGKLINSKNDAPVPFAAIKIKNISKGVTSNFDGGFKIPYQIQEIGDTLVISSIGYLSKEIILSNLFKLSILLPNESVFSVR